MILMLKTELMKDQHDTHVKKKIIKNPLKLFFVDHIPGDSRVHFCRSINIYFSKFIKDVRMV